ncbi:MAG: ATP-binding cassette domain-containing protein [Actinobacteria bacterium]|nr:ATP-binding cassette domain-containing protein [Actinomycetota bacterium]
MTATRAAPTPPGVELDGRVHLGGLDLAVALEVPTGSTLVITGPNGAGKTTLLRIIAGLVALDAGHLVVGGTTWDDAGRDIWRPPASRSVGFVFQDHALFPHLTAAENVAFGLRARRIPARAALTTSQRWLERVGLADYASCRPGELSGGQSQRVALARALCFGPDVLLLDEPFAALDPAARSDVQRLLADPACAPPMLRVVVTHDPDDAGALGGRTIRVVDGRIVEG